MAWYSGSWAYRAKITVDHTKVAASQTDFPIYVNLAHLPAGFFTHVRSDGGDIRVTAADGTTEVPREVVAISVGSSSGELHFKAATVSASADTDFYVYYGNAAATEPASSATYGRNNVWSKYQHVYHLESNTSPVDSTGNQDGTNVSTTSAATAKIGKGASFDSGKYIDVGLTGEHLSPLTVSGWLKPTSIGSQGHVASKGFDGTDTEWSLTLGADGKMSFSTFHSPSTVRGATDPTVLTANVWRRALGQYDGTTWSAVVDNGTPTTSVDGGTFPTSTKHMIGGVFNGTSPIQPFVGDLDEVRIAPTALGNNWSLTEYANQASPSTFYAAGVEETSGLSASPAGLTSAASFGAVTPLPGPVVIPVSGLGSAKAFGAVTALPGPRIVSVVSLGSAAAFGGVKGQYIQIASLGSAAQFGGVTTQGGVAPTFNPAITGGRAHR